MTESLSQIRLRELLTYDAETGEFSWIKVKRRLPGSKAGTLHSGGYISIKIDQVRHLSHRLAWFYVTGVWPPHDVDHINGQRDDNRFCNLRLASRSQNLQNMRRKGPWSKGVSFDERRRKFRATIQVQQHQKFLGYFTSEIRAHAAYVNAARKHFGEFARTS